MPGYWIRGISEHGRHELAYHLNQWDAYAATITLVLTCGCRGGRGHRFMANPTGASLGISIWDNGRDCLLARLGAAGLGIDDTPQLLREKVR